MGATTKPTGIVSMEPIDGFYSAVAFSWTATNANTTMGQPVYWRYEEVPNNDILVVHVTTKLNDRLHIGRLDHDEIPDLIEKLLALPGVVDASISLYELHVEKGAAFLPQEVFPAAMNLIEHEVARGRPFVNRPMIELGGPESGWPARRASSRLVRLTSF